MKPIRQRREGWLRAALTAASRLTKRQGDRTVIDQALAVMDRGYIDDVNLGKVSRALTNVEIDYDSI